MSLSGTVLRPPVLSLPMSTSKAAQRALEEAGRKRNANPSDWFASLASIPLRELHFQVWVGAWRDATSPADMARAWTERQG